MANKPKTAPQFSAEDAAVPVSSSPEAEKPVSKLVEVAPLSERPPSQNDPEGAPPVPPAPEPEVLALYPGNAEKGTFVLADGTIVRNC